MAASTTLIGAGTMGSQMISRLLDAGHRVRVFDPSEAAARAASQSGAEVLPSVAAAAGGADVCVLSLPTPAVVEDVTGESGLLAAEPLPGVVADTSTVDPATTRAAQARMLERGVGYLDAPVLGRPDRCGHWTLPIGGEAADIERARPTLEVLAAKLEHVGPAGTGNAVKLLNNLMLAAINAITTECLAGAERVGLDPAVFVDVIARSGAASVSNLFLEIGPKIVESDFEPAFTIELLHKDVGLALAMLEGAGSDSVLGPVLHRLTDRGMASGLGQLDTSALVELFRATQET